MSKLVSIIIPCFNAQKWISEAIESCLSQTYQAIEIIVIDDGSTDGSLDVIKRYKHDLIWESGSNRGGNYARNRGFALSKGEYIQYLDADDFLLPDKISKQISFLEESKVDVVYGDWRHQVHFPDGSFVLQDVVKSGKQEDTLASLLGNWWVSPACLLMRRTAVEKSGGWDENLKAGQDRDFFISLVMSGARVDYQSGCDSIYRRHGNSSVSTSSKPNFLQNHCSILGKAESKLVAQGMLSEKYRHCMAESYFSLARDYQDINDNWQYQQLLKKVLLLSPNFKIARTPNFNYLQDLFGFQVAEQITFLIKSNKKKLKKLFHSATLKRN